MEGPQEYTAVEVTFATSEVTLEAPVGMEVVNVVVMTSLLEMVEDNREEDLLTLLLSWFRMSPSVEYVADANANCART
eukprot:SAG22_NODE_1981_length_3210_cov_10.443909_2_plen_78_part_00